MILPSMLVQLNDIAKLRTFKLKGQMTKKALLYLFRYPSTGPYLDRSQAKKCTLATILTKSCGLQQHWCSGAPPGVVNPGSLFEPHGNSLCLVVDCGGYSFALMVNEGLFGNPRPPPSIQVAGRLSGGQQCRLNGGSCQRL